jgi:hypothetical protein
MTLEPIRTGFNEGMELLLIRAGILEPLQFTDLSIFTKPVSVENEPDKSNEGNLNIDDTAEPIDIQGTALNGAQVGSLLEVLTKISTGELPKDSAKAIISSAFPSFDTAKINSIVDPIQPNSINTVEQAAVYYSDHVRKLTIDIENQIITDLSEAGELIDENEFEELSATPVLEPNEEDQVLALFGVHSPADGEPQEKSKAGDAGLYKIRYRYGPPELKENSRELCTFLVGKAKAGVVYRKEEIISWQKEGINSEFAPKGKSNYSLWEWKGGAYCHHRWYRVIYFRKRGADGTFKPASKTPEMENDKTESLPQARSKGIDKKVIDTAGWPDAATRPIDTPNRGKLN